MNFTIFFTILSCLSVSSWGSWASSFLSSQHWRWPNDFSLLVMLSNWSPLSIICLCTNPLCNPPCCNNTFLLLQASQWSGVNRQRWIGDWPTYVFSTTAIRLSQPLSSDFVQTMIFIIADSFTEVGRLKDGLYTADLADECPLPTCSWFIIPFLQDP